MILVCGVPWAVTMILPFAIVGQGVSSREGGLYMGVLNIFVVLPQIMVSVFIPFVIKWFDHDVVAALVTGGFSSVIAALFTLRLISPSLPIQEVHATEETVDLLTNITSTTTNGQIQIDHDTEKMEKRSYGSAAIALPSSC